MSARPLIGLTPDLAMQPGEFGLPRYELKRGYTDAVLEAGGLPLVLPYASDAAVIASYLAMIDGLVVTGGAFDVPPELYGEAARDGMGETKPDRTNFELAMLQGALARDLPLLGVCGGMQLMNVACGGTLFQDIGREVPGALPHEQKIDRRLPAHEVTVAAGTLLARATGVTSLQVNSTHHQAVRRLGPGLVASASSSDAVVEAIELPGKRYALGVQWHPELLGASVPANLGIYRALVAAASQPLRARAS